MQTIVHLNMHCKRYTVAVATVGHKSLIVCLWGVLVSGRAAYEAHGRTDKLGPSRD